MKLDKLQIQKLEQFLEKIKNDTYPEPPTLLHSQITQQMFDVCLKQISLPPAAKILDIGCGGGLISEPMARLGATVTGIDASEKNIKIAKIHSQQSNLKIHIEWFNNEPF